jgi:hypothetical protein
MPKKPEPPTTHDWPPLHAMQLQLVLVLGTQPMPGQQLSPVLPPMPGINPPPIGALHARPAEAQVQLPAWQFGAFGVHVRPQPPQFAASVDVSMQVPPQQDWPAAQRVPVEPHTQLPPWQISPSAQALPSEPQLRGFVEVLTHWKRPPSFAHTSPGRHSAKSPHAHSGVLAPARMLHEIARSGSQRRPQPLQLLKGERGSIVLAGRPSTFGV